MRFTVQNLRASLSGEQRRGDIRGGLQAAALSLPLVVAAIWFALRRLTHRGLVRSKPGGAGD